MDGYDKRQAQECLEYFRNRPVFGKLFQKMKEKYASLGHVGGKVTLSGLTREEKMQLGGFFQKDYTENKTVTVSAEALGKCLSQSRFAGITAETLLLLWFGQDLITKKGEKEKAWKEREAYFASILQSSKDTAAGQWLDSLLKTGGAGYELLMQQYREDPVQLKEVLMNVIRAADRLPGSGAAELLPVFAANVTGNPHYFDTGTAAEKLLRAFIQASLPREPETQLTGAERMNRLYYRVGILKDDLSNEILCYGIRAWKPGGQVHCGVEGFFREKEPVRLTLRTLSGLERAKAAEKEIYVVENPAVFSAVTARYPQCAAVCVNGQPRLAALMLLDFLSQEHCFWYAGDFDPEGLLIAQRLKERYGESLRFWNYEARWYSQYLSDVQLDEKRLRKLDKIWLPELQEIKKRMQKEKKAVYQETMLNVYLSPETGKERQK